MAELYVMLVRKIVVFFKILFVEQIYEILWLATSPITDGSALNDN